VLPLLLGEKRPESNPHLNNVTPYTYDTLDGLTTVNQIGRARIFATTQESDLGFEFALPAANQTHRSVTDTSGDCKNAYDYLPFGGGEAGSRAARRRMIEDMAQVHMSEAELARDLHAVLDKVRQGVEVIVERNHQPVAVLRAAVPPRRTISECIALAEHRDKQRGYSVTLDPDFAAAVEQIVCNRKPWNPSTWD